MITKINANINYNSNLTKTKCPKQPAFEGMVHLHLADPKKCPNFFNYCECFFNHLNQYVVCLEKDRSTNNSFSIKYPEKYDLYIEKLFNSKRVFNTSGMELKFERGDVNFTDKYKIN